MVSSVDLYSKTSHVLAKKWSSEDERLLDHAIDLLESPGLTAKLTNALGKVVEDGLKQLPQKWSEKINEITRAALQTSLKVAIATLNTDKHDTPSNFFHKLSVAATGAAGGAFGLSALALELPISTTIMLRSIADIARSEGEDFTQTEVAAACIEVFALGGKSPEDDASESGYFATRLALSRAITEASQHIAAKGFVEEGAPALVKLIATVAQRFSIQVSEKAAAQLLPAIGAAGGALVNTLFMSHFQQMAHGHFVIRRLERTYGFDEVKKRYMAKLLRETKEITSS